MSRWNAVAQGVTLPAFGSGTFDFLWAPFDDFPHPTFRGGSAEAYRAFAGLLLQFLQAADNFDYLAVNQLFAVELHAALGLVTTFAALAAQLSAPDSWFGLDEATRLALRVFSERMNAG